MIKIRTNKSIIEFLSENEIIIKGEEIKVVKDGYEIKLEIINSNYTNYNGRVFYITNIFDLGKNLVISIETDKGSCYVIPAEMFFYVYNIRGQVRRIVEETESDEEDSNKNYQYEDDEEDNDSYDCCDNDYDDDDQYEEDDNNYDEDDECD